MSFEHNLYLAWLVPSTLSFALSSIVLLNILFSSRLRKLLFQQLSAALAVADLVQSIGWFMGPKYVGSGQMCRTQEYMFQLGMLYKAAITVVICRVIANIVSETKLPSGKSFILFAGSFLLLPLVAAGISFAYDTHILFCGDWHSTAVFNEQSLHHQNAIIAYVITVIFFVYSCAVIDLIYFVYMQQAYKNKIRITLNASVQNDNHMQTIANRLLMFPFIFAIGFLPATISLFVQFIWGTQWKAFTYVAAAGAASTGWCIAFSYLFYQDIFGAILRYFTARSDSEIFLSELASSQSYKDSEAPSALHMSQYSTDESMRRHETSEASSGGFSPILHLAHFGRKWSSSN